MISDARRHWSMVNEELWVVCDVFGQRFVTRAEWSVMSLVMVCDPSGWSVMPLVNGLWFQVHEV